MNITPELQVERKQDSNQVEFAVIPALKGARIKCIAGVRSVRGGKRDLYPVLLQDGVFLSYRKVLNENFLYEKKRSARMSTRTIGKY